MRTDRGPYWKRATGAALALASTLALGGCFSWDDHSAPPGIFGPPASASPAVPESWVQPQQDFEASILGVANRIMADAGKAKAQVVQSNNFTIGNYAAIHADHEALVDTTMPQIKITYNQGQGQVRIESLDLAFPSDHQTAPTTYNGIMIIYTTKNVPANTPNALDNILHEGKSITLADFHEYINSGDVTLYNVAQQTGIPYKLDIMQLQPDGTYQSTRVTGDAYAPSYIASADPSILSEYSGALENLETTLSQGIK